MSKLLLVRDDKFQDHLTPQVHPESPKRLAAIDKVLQASHEIEKLKVVSPKAASVDQIALVHTEEQIDKVLQLAKEAQEKSSIVAVDADTWMGAESFDIAKLAAGAGIVALDTMAKNSAPASSFIAVRPPGHHALAVRSMGFCLFNNIAIAARHAQKKVGARCVLIIDWDVHHGNGTQAIFYNDPTVCFVSFHQYPFWSPNSGWYLDDGEGEGKGYNINIPLPAGTGDKGYLQAWDQILTPIASEYKPDLILVSAGYDAHQADPLGDQKVTTAGFAQMTRRVTTLAQATKANVACFLEGGYNTEPLSQSVLATIQILNHEKCDELLDSNRLSDNCNDQAVAERIAELRKHFSKYWKLLKGS